MTLLWTDGFDAQIALDYRWAANPSDRKPALSSGGRFGGYCLLTQNNNSYDPVCYRSIPGSSDTIYVGFAIKALWSNYGDNNYLAILNNDAGSAIVTLTPTSTGAINLVVGSTTVATSPADAYPNGYWCYMEIGLHVNDAGWVDVRVNGNTVVNFSGDTNVYASTAIARLTLGNGGRYYDDFYVCDNSGTTNNNFLGDVRVICLSPDGNGTFSQGTGSDGNSVDNYALVDEVPANSLDYVDLATGEKDTYTFADLSGIGATSPVYAVQTSLYAKKDDVGLINMSSVARLSGVETTGAAHAMSTDDAPYIDVMETKPGGGGWTVTDINNAEFGAQAETP